MKSAHINAIAEMMAANKNACWTPEIMAAACSATLAELPDACKYRVCAVFNIVMPIAVPIAPDVWIMEFTMAVPSGYRSIDSALIPFV